MTDSTTALRGVFDEDAGLYDRVRPGPTTAPPTAKTVRGNQWVAHHRPWMVVVVNG